MRSIWSVEGSSLLTVTDKGAAGGERDEIWWFAFPGGEALARSLAEAHNKSVEACDEALKKIAVAAGAAKESPLSIVIDTVVERMGEWGDLADALAGTRGELGDKLKDNGTLRVVAHKLREERDGWKARAEKAELHEASLTELLEKHRGWHSENADKIAKYGEQIAALESRVEELKCDLATERRRVEVLSAEPAVAKKEGAGRG